MHRFINADSYATADATDPVSCNMFAYCGNNPVVRFDIDGELWNVITGIVGAIAGAAVGITASIISEDSVGEIVFSGISGAACGFIVGFAPCPQTILLVASYNAALSYVDSRKSGASTVTAVKRACVAATFSFVASDTVNYWMNLAYDVVFSVWEETVEDTLFPIEEKPIPSNSTSLGCSSMGSVNSIGNHFYSVQAI